MHKPLIVGKLVVILLGLVIANKAWNGYKAHGSQSMFYLAWGFLLISIASGIEGLLYELLNISIFEAGTIQTFVAAIGMLTVLYSLYGSHATAVSG
jgi:hypothetical protein